MRIVGLALSAALLSSCAKSPESIAPSYVSNVGFRSWSCKDLGDETLRLSSALSTASMQQANARTNDTIGVLFIGMPVSSMSGDNIAPEVARLKGEIEAVHQASIEKKCGG
jgi:hypothetical protein